MNFTDAQNSKIEKLPLYELERGYRQLCEIEVELESRLEVVRELKSRIMVEIEIKLRDKK